MLPWTYVSIPLRYILWSGIAGFYDNSMFNFFEELQEISPRLHGDKVPLPKHHHPQLCLRPSWALSLPTNKNLENVCLPKVSSNTFPTNSFSLTVHFWASLFVLFSFPAPKQKPKSEKCEILSKNKILKKYFYVSSAYFFQQYLCKFWVKNEE